VPVIVPVPLPLPVARGGGPIGRRAAPEARFPVPAEMIGSRRDDVA
jgi:hypothetical protein